MLPELKCMLIGQYDSLYEFIADNIHDFELEQASGILNDVLKIISQRDSGE